MTASGIFSGIKTDSLRRIVVAAHKAQRKEIDEAIALHSHNISRYLPGFRHPKDAPAAKVEDLVMSRNLWRIPEVSRVLLKSWFLQAKQLESVISSKLASCGYLCSQVDFDHDRISPKKLRGEDVHKSAEDLFFFIHREFRLKDAIA